ncbi:hypothetical protein CYY_010052 [Polysphondylium violaceum]|uniref:LIM zinc-binding domain-containing protein n=1 Tax=Polysphondylium violaceum TaxID=133409 RepID=A0A8J4UVG1_9MYCE|nr:hypothetical protein CYY_010052 [Polysphondylium violaceum]
MDDLDILLADLGRPKSGVKTNPTPSSNGKAFETNDIHNEIQSIIEELDAQPQQVVTTTTTVTPIKANFSVTVETPAPAPVVNHSHQHSHNNNTNTATNIEGADDLDELMESLNSSITTALKAVPSHPEESKQPSYSKPADNNSPTQTRVTSTATMVKKPVVVSKAVLETTAPKQSNPVTTPTPVSHNKPTNSPSTDDLDELLKNLSPSQPATIHVPAPVSVNSKPSPTKPYQPEVVNHTTTVHFNHNQNNNHNHNHNVSNNNNNNNNNNKGKVLQGDDLDNLLNNLTSQVKDIDSSGPSSRGTCFGCKRPIFGEVIQASSRFYHPEHFVCNNCQNPLGTRNFYEQDNLAHCEKCYQELFCARCAHCDDPISDRCITALGKKWHVHHFVCTQCLKPFEGGNFFERDGRPYCEADFYNTFASRCGGCNGAIRGECINALGTQWHPEHFVCQYCQKSFTNGSFFEFGGKPYCDIHYHQQAGSVCSGCGKTVTGRCVDALDKKWHPEHFVCAFCMNPLAGGSYTANNGKPYCKNCHTKLFG